MENQISLSDLKKIFLTNYKSNFLYSKFKLIYQRVEKEFILLFNETISGIELNLNIKIIEEHKDIIKYNLMLQLCYQLIPVFKYYQSRYELNVVNSVDFKDVKVIFYTDENDKISKEKKLGELSKIQRSNYFILYVELEYLRYVIRSLLYLLITIFSITRVINHKLIQMLKYIKNSKEHNWDGFIADAILGQKFKGKKLSPEKEKLYKDILKLQKHLQDEYGISQISSLTNSIRRYSQTNKLHWNAKQIKSTTETIRVLKSNNKI